MNWPGLPHRGKLDDASALLSRALKPCAEDPEKLLHVASLYNDLDKFEVALPLIKRVLRLRPEYTAALWVLGTAYNGLHKSRLASRAFKKFLSTDETPYALRGLATVKRRAGRHDHAVVLYAASILIEPKNVSAYNNMALSLNTLGRHKEAIKTCKAGLKLDPKDDGLRLNLIVAHRQANNNDVA
jgi:tetratricopeptide (TPR) repeat protein